MATTKTRYLVVTTPKKVTSARQIHAYSKCTSNKAIMEKYYEEIKNRYPNENVYLLTVEQTKELKKRVTKHFRDIEEAKLRRLDERMAKLNAYYTFYDNFKR